MTFCHKGLWSSTRLWKCEMCVHIILKNIGSCYFFNHPALDVAFYHDIFSGVQYTCYLPYCPSLPLSVTATLMHSACCPWTFACNAPCLYSPQAHEAQSPCQVPGWMGGLLWCPSVCVCALLYEAHTMVTGVERVWRRAVTRVAIAAPLSPAHSASTSSWCTPSRTYPLPPHSPVLVCGQHTLSHSVQTRASKSPPCLSDLQ